MNKLLEQFDDLMKDITPSEKIEEAVGSGGMSTTSYTAGDIKLNPTKEKASEKKQHKTLTPPQIEELKSILQIVRSGRKDYIINFIDDLGNINSINSLMIEKTSGIKAEQFTLKFMGRLYNIKYEQVTKVYEPYRYGFMQVIPVPNETAPEESEETQEAEANTPVEAEVSATEPK